MEKVKRYHFGESYGGSIHIVNIRLGGEYVRYVDYLRVVKENRKLKSKIVKLKY